MNNVVSTRGEINAKIVGVIVDAILTFPEFRFEQLMTVLGVIPADGTDYFYEEPDDTLIRVSDKLQQLKDACTNNND